MSAIKTSMSGAAASGPVAEGRQPSSESTEKQLGESKMGAWMLERFQSTGKPRGTEGVDGDRTLVGEAVQRGFATEAFIEAGASAQDWFSIPEEFRAKFLAYAKDGGYDGQAMLDVIDRVIRRLNGFLARSDIDVDAKVSMLSSLLSDSSGDYDEGISSGVPVGSVASRMGDILAELISGNGRVLFGNLIEVNGVKAYTGKSLEIDELNAISVDVEKSLTQWMKDNEVSIKPDRSAEYFANLRSFGQENLDRRAGMTLQEQVADIEAQRARMAHNIRNNEKAEAPMKSTSASRV
jgi:hypothetical protein